MTKGVHIHIRNLVHQAVCVFVAALLHYFFLAAFCWMLCEGIYLFLILVIVLTTLSKKWWLFLLIGWGKTFDHF